MSVFSADGRSVLKLTRHPQLFQKHVNCMPSGIYTYKYIYVYVYIIYPLVIRKYNVFKTKVITYIYIFIGNKKIEHFQNLANNKMIGRIRIK